MTMERWSVHRYRLPHLDVQAVRMLDDGLELDSPRGVFKLTCDEPSVTERELASMLDALRDPRSGLWSAIRDRSPGSNELLPMLRELDHLGLIRDGSAAGSEQLHADIEHAVRAWSSDLGRDLALHGEDAARVVERIAAQLEAAAPGTLAATLEQPSFPVLTLVLQGRYLRDNAPAVLGLLVEGLRAAARWARGGASDTWWSGIRELPSWAATDWSCGLVERRGVQRYLLAAGRLVRDALGPGADRRARSTTAPREPLSGINFLLDLEADVSQWLTGLGPSPVISAIHDRALARRVIKAAFLQEYLVTCRFVECISPLLARRFPAPLRDAVHRYFAEEMGHETFERENCLRLGWTAQQIDDADPLPLHLAFVDILTCIARESPICFFSASMFTEGIIGAQHSLVSLALQAMPDDPELARALGDHVAINDDSDHRAVGRDWMSRVPLVARETQQEASELLAYLAELNWRMWDQLVQSCAVERDRAARR